MYPKHFLASNGAGKVNHFFVKDPFLQGVKTLNEKRQTGAQSKLGNGLEKNNNIERYCSFE